MSARNFDATTAVRTWLTAMVIAAITVACGGQDPILGTGGVVAPVVTVPPTVTAVAPVAGATAVPTNTRIFTAAFSRAMDPTTLTATSFALACPATSPIAGTVSYVATGNVATLTLPTTTSLPATTVCTATISTAAKDTTGVALAAPFTWSFTTGAAPDVTAPTVSATVPLLRSTGAALNTAVSVSFSEPIDPLTVNASTILLACPTGTAIAGAVSYAVSGNVATLTPTAALPATTICTATVTTGIKDVAGNALAAPYVFTFTTGAAPDTTAPTVAATTPARAATGVALNARITATFSEPMDPLSLNSTTFLLSCPTGTAVAGTIGYAVSGNVATFTPTTSLPAGVVCTSTITTGARDVAGNALAAPYTWTFTTGAAPDITPPTVSSTTPLAGATGVAINGRIAVSFSEPMDPLTISTATIMLACPVGTPVAGTVGYATTGNVATFTPTASLPANTICRATVTTGVKDVAGNTLSVAYTWTFTTGAAPDTTAPTVTSTIPAAGATAVAINSRISVTFSEAMDPLTINGTTFTLACPVGTAITGTVGYAVSGNVATFTPAASLPANTACIATITTGAKDVAGNALAVPYTWTFTTGAVPDTTAPTVSSTIPAAGATSVAINSRISVSFSEAMDPLTINTATISLACPPGTPIGGTVGYAASGNVATFTPTVSLPATTNCTATVTTGVRDVAGNPLAAPYVWTFTTGAAPDTTRPTVTSTIPANGATLVAFNAQVTATFSEPMDPLTINTATFVLACPAATPIAGTVAYATGSNSATFTPTANLPPATTCTATITTGARDVAGNALAAPYTWTFTTGAVPDTTPPTVTSTVPAAGATGVALNAGLSVFFSEPMDPLSITTATLLLACPAGTPVAGTVAYVASGNTATFTPAVNLPAATVCTATVTTGARDVAGNALAAPFVWTFTTGAAPDTTAPTVTSTVPAAGATNVFLNARVTATFSEAMDPLTITATTFLVTCPTGTPVAGAVAYAVSGNVATFTPAADLPASTTCRATITTGAKDVAGNALAAPYVWTFTTGVAPDIVPPLVSSTNPVNLSFGICTNKTISATFSEAMDPLTITSATFTLQPAVGTPVAGTIAYDPITFIATFRPTVSLVGTPSTIYTATIHGGPTGVKDLAGNPLAADFVLTFTTNASTCATAPPLGAAAPFVAFGGNATLTNDGVNTVLNGDVGVNAASTTVTGLRDSGGNVYTVTLSNDGLVNGLVYSLTAPPASVPGAAVRAARGDALTAFNSISPGNLPGGIDVSNLAQCPSCGGAGGGADELAGRTLPPGIYRSTTGTFDIGGASRTVGNLVLDAGGDADAVWIFQTAAGTGTLNVGLTGPATPATPIMVTLLNGAQSKNVFWFTPAGAAIGTGSTMVGTILADATITVSTTGTAPLPVVTTLNGRALALTAGVTLANTVINRPAP